MVSVTNFGIKNIFWEVLFNETETAKKKDDLLQVTTLTERKAKIRE